MRNCWSMSRYTISVMVVSMKKKGHYWVLQNYLHQTCSVLLHYESSKLCICNPYKIVYTFKVVKHFWKHPVFRGLYYCFLCWSVVVNSPWEFSYVAFFIGFTMWCGGLFCMNIFAALPHLFLPDFLSYRVRVVYFCYWHS
jgi:hypothetical protein